MKAKSLDQYRGYTQDHYGEVNQASTTAYMPKTSAAGYQIFGEPMWNKGRHSQLQVTLIAIVCYATHIFFDIRMMIDDLSHLMTFCLQFIYTYLPRARTFIYTRGTRIQKPYRAASPHHGEPPDPVREGHEDD